MKSKDIINWRYELFYKEIASLDDFPKLLTDAIATDRCITCGGDKVLNDGLCLGCSRELKDEDRKVSDYILKSVTVRVQVGLPDDFENNLMAITEKDYFKQAD